MTSIQRQEDGRVTIAGVTIDIIEKGEGTPIVFLHPGIGNTLDDPFLADLATGHRVIAPVLPGFGNSDLPRPFAKTEDLAQYVLGLLKELDLRDVILIGASFGGWVAAEVAIRSTERLSHLVLLAPLGVRSGADVEREVQDIWGLPKAALRELQFSDPEKGIIPYHEMDEKTVEGAVRSGEAEALFGWAPYMHNPVLSRWLPAIDVPTLVLRGSDDQFVVAENTRFVADSIPGATYDVLQGAGHYPHIEQSNATVEAIAAFVGTTATASEASA